MNQSIPLYALREGESAKVTGLHVGGGMRRLQDMGLIEGTRISCTQKSPFGDPTAYAIRGAIIALRTQDAAGILVQTAPAAL